MGDQYKTIGSYLSALVLLALLGQCRKLPIAVPVRSGLVYGGYLLLILVWMFSMYGRISQGHIRRFLMGEGALMGFGILVRFVQEAFLQDHMMQLRFSGHLVSATLLPILLCGLFGCLGLGEGEEYTQPKAWYLLGVPVAVLVLLDLTDEIHHWVFRILPGEPYPSVIFHPYIGFVLIVILGFLIMGIRILCIYRRSVDSKKELSLRSVLPMLELPLILLFSMPYMLSAFSDVPELIELFAGLYYLEMLFWEVCILVGLVPVNTQYPSVFEHATLGMQIVDPKGRVLLRSTRSEDITGEMIRRLKAEHVLVRGGTELRIHENSDTSFIWQRDISDLQRAVRDLEAVEADLIQEGQLLEEEYRARSEEARVDAQNRIYSLLSGECASQLRLMQELAKKCRNGNDDRRRYETLFIIGTYVKRRCQLRLTVGEDGSLAPEDIRLAYEDLAAALRSVGMEAYCRVECDAEPAGNAEYWIGGLDFVERVLEEHHFRVKRLFLRVEQGMIQCRVEGCDEGSFMADMVGRYPVEVRELPGAIEYTMREEG